MAKYNRSRDYRYQFIKNNPGYKKDYKHYHCAYCGKKILKENMEVDHIISVHKAKTTFAAKFLMWFLGLKDVNDPRNLVASCSRCNRRKGSMGNDWLIAAVIGRSYNLWIVRKTLRACIFLALTYIVVKRMLF